MVPANAPILRIMSISGTSPVAQVPLTKDLVTIGRDAGNDVVLSSDPSVSRRHLTLTKRGAIWYVTCLPGVGLLFVNGRQTDDADIRQGDQLVIGGTVLRVELPDTADEGQSPRSGHPATVLASEPDPQLIITYPAGRFIAPLREVTITLGRAPESGIVVPSPLISAHHAVLHRGPGGTYTIEDVGALNSFSVHGTLTRTHTFEPGDTITIGDRSRGAFVALTYTAPQMLASTAPLDVPPSGMVTIGRDPTSSHCLPNPLVSWHHARLRRDATGAVMLEDRGSTNGTYVNYARISQRQSLRPHDRIHVGPYEFLFNGTQLVPVSQPGGMRVDAYDLVRTVRSGQTVLLDHITVSMLPGEFVTIVGGNGAGKSTLMKALAGIQPAQHGHVLFNGLDSYQHYAVLRGLIGYVPQADIVHSALTIERALYYAARLRLASDLREDEIDGRIEAVLDAVDLGAHRHKVIATLSGGERKRVSLAVELLAEPPLLFLDEPNAALDPNHRRELLHTIRTLTARGHTIVMVTHFLEDIQACDRVAVMGRGGRLCYFGASGAAPSFFQVASFADIYSQVEENSQASAWKQRFEQSDIYAREVRARTAANAQRPPSKPLSPGTRPGRSTGIPTGNRSASSQLGLLTHRYVEVLAHDRTNVAILLLQAPLIGLVLALVSNAGVFTSSDGPFEAQKVLFFLAVVAIWFGTSNAVREISKEGEIYQRERLTGLGVVPYVLSKVTILALLCLVQTLILLVIVSAKTGLPPEGASLYFSSPVELYISVSLAGLAGLALGLCVSAFASNPDKAISAVPLVLLPQILLAGVIFPVSGPVRPIADITISRWAVEALGTTADLNHLYYTQLSEQSVSAQGGVGAHPASGATSAFEPSDYDSQPSAANYTPSVAAGASWADALNSRQRHLLLTWTVLVLLFGVFVTLTGIRQRAKDPT